MSKRDPGQSILANLAKEKGARSAAHARRKRAMVSKAAPTYQPWYFTALIRQHNWPPGFKPVGLT